MNKIVPSAIPLLLRLLISLLIVPLLSFSSCASDADRRDPTLDEFHEITQIFRPFMILDFKNKAEGQGMPEWVDHWLEGGISALEALGAYEGRLVFISRNEGTNFNALTQWAEWFSSELDFPRLAAARIESRFLSGVSRPDNVYGAFFVNLIRAASDARWAGAVKEDYFWIRRKFYPVEDDITETGGAVTLVDEDWEFLILVTIEKTSFAYQLDAVFRSIRPNPQPTRDQIAAVNRVKDNFFYGF